MNQQKRKNNATYKIIGVFFLFVIALAIINNIRKSDEIVYLTVPNNSGGSLLETVDDCLVCVFQDGQVAAWNWNNLPQLQAEFSVGTNRIILLDTERLAAINETDKKLLTFYDMITGEKTTDIAVGREDQQVWPRISFGKNIVALIRRNPSGSAGTVLYEFLTLDVDNEILGVPVSLNLQANSETFVDYAVDGKGILYAVGSQNDVGRIMAINLETGKNVWDKIYGPAQEFCSVMVSPRNDYLLVGSRDGRLCKIDSGTGDLIKTIQLLEEGETRPITNDFSVLNPAFSPDGQYYVVTINPKAYFLESGRDRIIHIATPADRLVSRIAFSPDNRYFAASDVRVGYPVKVWPMPQNE